MKKYKHLFVKSINNELFGYLHETDTVVNPEDGDLYQINPDDVFVFLKSDLFKKETDVDDYPFVNYDNMLNHIKLDLFHQKYDVLSSTLIGDVTSSNFFEKHATLPKTMIFYSENYNKIVDKKAVNKIVDYIELNFSTNEKVIDKFKTFLKQFDIKLK